MTVPFLDLSWQEKQISDTREALFQEIISSNAFVLGPFVSRFEKEFAQYVGANESVGVSGGTHALTMIFNALNIGKGDEVIMIPTTFFASASSVVFAGATPVFVDIDPLTRDFDFTKLRQAINPNTKAILAVHLYGHAANMQAISDIAEEYNLIVVEDASQAHGALFNGKRVGTFGAASAFSFYPGKNLGAYGDGGAVATDNPEIAKKVRALRNQGCVERYDHTYLGYNGRLDALQAAVLLAKLPHLDKWNQMRREIAEKYLANLAGLPITLPPVRDPAEPVWHLFVIEVAPETREDLIVFLAGKGIATGKHYPIPVHLTPAFNFLNLSEGSYPAAERLAASAVSLPVYPGMTSEQVEVVVEAIKEYFHAN